MDYIIKSVHLDNRELIRIKASKTSRDLSLFFPPEEFSRNEMINMIRQGDTFYKWYRDGRKVPIVLKFTVNLEIDQFDDVTRF
jgi:hypothetical protein